ncbi:hypothetical protein C427_3790 [Paraglaciecola psychrophila 170]|uniref:Uncharacterized protein n=1 Tax=Paraglaciecola psychrophila 170 TaxID=1129794 RepID=M4RTB4_9ALTE|nr:hypothetical protein C427_3790 [Paraglaciecola psychrophila 170]
MKQKSKPLLLLEKASEELIKGEAGFGQDQNYLSKVIVTQVMPY